MSDESATPLDEIERLRQARARRSGKLAVPRVNGGPPETRAKDGDEARFDPVTGESLEAPLRALSRMSGIEFLAVEQIGEERSRWRVTVRHPSTGEPVVVGPLTSEQMLNMTHLLRLIWEATGHTLRAFKKNSEAWCAFMQALKRAATVVPHDVTEASVWRERVGAFVRDRTSPLDPEDSDDRRRITAEGSGVDCFVDPRGRLWIERAALSRFVNMALRARVSDEDVGTGLAALGFTAGDAGKVQSKVDGKVRVRRFWRSPSDFDPAGE
jgi:hypothetical protein